MLTRICILFVLFAEPCSVAWSAPTLSGTPDELRDLLGLAQPARRVVSMHGHAEQTAYADRAIVAIVVTTENRTLAGALEVNATLRASLVATLRAAGIAGEMINTAKFSTSPQFGLFGSDPNSFQVSNRIDITVSDEQEFRAVGSVVDDYEEVRLTGTEFEHSDKKRVEDEVRREALEDAMSEREFFSHSLGLTLRPVSFRSGPVVVPVRAFADSQPIEEIMVTAQRRANAPVSSQAPSASAGFDKIIYRADVEIDFEVVPREE